MKKSFQLLLVLALFLAVPQMARANLNANWDQNTCPKFVGAESCGNDYVNTAAPNPLTCATLATMNARENDCENNEGGTLRCSGVCYWQSSQAYCDGLNRNTRTLTESPSSPNDTDYTQPNLNQCGGCKSGYQDVGGTCTKIYHLADVGGNWNAYDPTGGPPQFQELALDSLWTETSDDIYYDDGAVVVGYDDWLNLGFPADVPYNFVSTQYDTVGDGQVTIANLSLGVEGTTGESAIGTYGYAVNDGTGEAYGVYAVGSSVSGTSYGVYASGSDYSVYANNGDAYFADRVGIGTSTPGAGLHIKNGGWPDSFIWLDTDATGQDAGIRLYEAGTVKWHLYNNAAAPAPGDEFQIRNNANQLHFIGFQDGRTTLAFDAPMRVGIGTTTPAAKLDVNGTAIIQGDVEVPQGGICLDTDGSCSAVAGGVRIGPAGIDVTNSANNLLTVDVASTYFSGDIGIGDSTPNARLDVEGEVRLHSIYGEDSSNLQITSNSGYFVDIRPNDPSYGLIIRQNGDTSDYANIEVLNSYINIGHSTSGADVRIHDNGQFQIMNGPDTTASNGTLKVGDGVQTMYIDGNEIESTSAIHLNWNSARDVRVKGHLEAGSIGNFYWRYSDVANPSDGLKGCQNASGQPAGTCRLVKSCDSGDRALNVSDSWSIWSGGISNHYFIYLGSDSGAIYTDPNGLDTWQIRVLCWDTNG